MSLEALSKYPVLFKDLMIYIHDIIRSSPDAILYSATSNNNQTFLAKLFHEDNADQFDLEVSSISALGKHHYLLEFIDTSTYDFKKMILYSLPSTHTFDSLNKSKISDQTFIISLFMQLLIALSHIHRSGFVHQNISLENIGFDPLLNLKLFGFNEMRKTEMLQEMKEKHFKYFSGKKSPSVHKAWKHLFLGPTIDMSYLGELLSEIDPQRFICERCMQTENDEICKNCEVWKTLRLFEKRLKNDSPLMRGNIREMVFILLSKKQLKKIPVFKELAIQFNVDLKDLEYQKILEKLFSDSLENFDLAVFTRIVSEIYEKFKNFRDLIALIEKSARVNLQSYATVLKVLTLIYIIYVSGYSLALRSEYKLSFLDTIMQIWFGAVVASIEVLREYVNIIRGFIHVILAKFNFHSITGCLGDWSLVSLNHKQAPSLLVSYWKRIKEFSEIISETPSLLFSLRETILSLLYSEVSSFFSKAEAVVKSSPSYTNIAQDLLTSFDKLGSDLRLTLSLSMTRKVFDYQNLLFPRSYSTHSYQLSVRTPVIVLEGKNNLKAEFIGFPNFNDIKTKFGPKTLNDVVCATVFHEQRKFLVHFVQRLDIESASCGIEFFEIAKRVSSQFVLNIAGHQANKKGLKVVSLDIFNFSLFKALHEAKRILSNKEKLLIALDIADGMEHLTKHGLTHTNLRSDHIFLENFYDHDSSPLLIKIYNYGSLFRTIKISENLYEGVSWDSEEVLQGAIPNQLSDVYSYGQLLGEIFTNTKVVNVARKIPSNSFVDFCVPEINLEELDNDLECIKNLIQKCIAKDLSLRPTFKQIKEELMILLR